MAAKTASLAAKNEVSPSASVIEAERGLEKPQTHNAETVSSLEPKASKTSKVALDHQDTESTLVDDSNETSNIKSNTEGKVTSFSPQPTTLYDSNSPELHTHPLFPPLPVYPPPSTSTRVTCIFFQITSFFLSLAFLGGIVVASLITSIPEYCRRIFCMITCQNHRKKRLFYEEELRRADLRQEKEKAWHRRAASSAFGPDAEAAERYPPTAGGRDPILCDVAYYARRVGLDVDKVKVRTDDGFIIDLWHVYDPTEYEAVKGAEQAQQGPPVYQRSNIRLKNPGNKRKFPVLLMHGLLQSSGAYCCNDDESLAFWLCKSGYDVWLGNNRCGFEPKHDVLEYNDPRMWSWNIRQMGTLDLSALTDRVLIDTGFKKLGLICHSQGTTQTFVALAKEQRPELGDKFTIFCALAPAAYAGPLIKRSYFRFMRHISPTMFYLIFGIHAFIPFMMLMQMILPPELYGWLGYKVFSFLFDWSDARWDPGLRNRLFQFAPVYVSSEAMRWWLGREGFARHKCILATRETIKGEDELDAHDDDRNGVERSHTAENIELRRLYGRGATAWYNERAPPMALWVCGNDELVDGQRLLRRLENGREPHVRLVYSKVIEGYEHLDVLWAMDAVEQVFTEMREVLWKTCDVRERCVVPTGCERVQAWSPAERELK